MTLRDEKCNKFYQIMMSNKDLFYFNNQDYVYHADLLYGEKLTIKNYGTDNYYGKLIVIGYYKKDTYNEYVGNFYEIFELMPLKLKRLFAFNVDLFI